MRFISSAILHSHCIFSTKNFQALYVIVKEAVQCHSQFIREKGEVTGPGSLLLKELIQAAAFTRRPTLVPRKSNHSAPTTMTQKLASPFPSTI